MKLQKNRKIERLQVWIASFEFSFGFLIRGTDEAGSSLETSMILSLRWWQKKEKIGVYIQILVWIFGSMEMQCACVCAWQYKQAESSTQAACGTNHAYVCVHSWYSRCPAACTVCLHWTPGIFKKHTRCSSTRVSTSPQRSYAWRARWRFQIVINWQPTFASKLFSFKLNIKRKAHYHSTTNLPLF